MERLRERLSLAEKALATLDEVETLALPDAVARDITIMRFIYTFEACWRALQRYLNLVEGVDVETPKACMRGARDAGLLTNPETETALVMVDDRNLTVHTYNEQLAEQIIGRMAGHVSVMRSLLAAMMAR
ncbi:MAG: nucleotidyltransferase substrate binding protein [Proteobacteria bacterium]|nr:nucleotidyltransferase substrate binding protein [Pseudomonadota bacterium]